MLFAQLGKFTTKSLSCILEEGELHIHRAIYFRKGRLGVSCVGALLHYLDSSTLTGGTCFYPRVENGDKLWEGLRESSMSLLTPTMPCALLPQAALSLSGHGSLLGLWRYQLSPTLLPQRDSSLGSGLFTGTQNK